MEWMGISGGDGVVCGYWFVYFFYDEGCVC